MKLLKYAQYLVRKHEGTELAKKVVANDAKIEFEENGATEEFYDKVETLQYIEAIEEN